ncbi:hypothetical protein ABN028_34505 [Actinopolymorpha sp. B17G11]|uniref:hypothetical protein n=1 Tax=Actinopolymorpha sp. B17G11 TaxID=3160861 RepID=UPI0032E4316A
MESGPGVYCLKLLAAVDSRGEIAQRPHPIMRRLLTTFVGAILLWPLSACTPPHEPIVALAVRGDRPIGVLVTCAGSFSSLSVYEDRPASSDASLVAWTVDGDGTGEVLEVELFGPPPLGWQVREDALTELRAGVQYSLWGASRRYAISVDFTTADLARIGPDQVLVAEHYHEAAQVKSQDSFVDKARDAC